MYHLGEYSWPGPTVDRSMYCYGRDPPWSQQQINGVSLSLVTQLTPVSAVEPDHSTQRRSYNTSAAPGVLGVNLHLVCFFLVLPQRRAMWDSRGWAITVRGATESKRMRKLGRPFYQRETCFLFQTAEQTGIS